MYNPSRFTVQPITENRFQPMIGQHNNKDAIVDLFGDSEPFIPKSPVSTTLSKFVTSTRSAKPATRITISNSELDDNAQKYAKLHNNTIVEVSIYLMVLFSIAIFFVAMKQMLE